MDFWSKENCWAPAFKRITSFITIWSCQEKIIDLRSYSLRSLRTEVMQRARRLSSDRIFSGGVFFFFLWPDWPRFPRLSFWSCVSLSLSVGLVVQKPETPKNRSWSLGMKTAWMAKTLPGFTVWPSNLWIRIKNEVKCLWEWWSLIQQGFPSTVEN